MGGMADFERKLIRARCDEGIKRAKARGTVFGRKPVLDAGERRKIAERFAAGETMAEPARDYDVGVATIHRTIHGIYYSLPCYLRYDDAEIDTTSHTSHNRDDNAGILNRVHGRHIRGSWRGPCPA